MKRSPGAILVYALLLSVMLHLLALGAGELSLPDFSGSDDVVLAKKKAKAVPKVSLNASPNQPKPEEPLPPGVIRVVIGGPPPAPAHPAKPPAAHKPKAKPKTEHVAAISPAPPALETSAAEPELSAPQPVAADDAARAAPPQVDASAKAALPPKIEPPPNFPAESTAVYNLHYSILSAEARQVWRMEGNSYSVEYSAKKTYLGMGYVVGISSEGSITPEGLKPELFRFVINDKLSAAAQFNHESKTLFYGKPGDPKQAALEANAQDFASMPFQVAVTFSDTQHLQVTTGKSVYGIELKLEAEETLKLPAGTIRTLHLKGSRKTESGTVQDGYDVWLAPDYRNYPVKFRGPDGSGRVMEFSIKSLEFEGKAVLGKGSEGSTTVPPSPEIPAESSQMHNAG